MLGVTKVFGKGVVVMTVDQMKCAMIQLYGGAYAWRQKVLAFSDDQTLAVYKKLEKGGEFQRLQVTKKKEKEVYTQCRLF
jgi:hypothetical protein